MKNDKIVAQSSCAVGLKSSAAPGQPADIKLTDVNLVITKIYNYESNALLEVSPGIYNQGEGSKPLRIEVTAQLDEYTAYTGADEAGIVQGESRVRGKMILDVPRYKEYTITVSVIESGKTVVSGKVDQKIKINELKLDTPVT